MNSLDGAGAWNNLGQVMIRITTVTARVETCRANIEITSLANATAVVVVNDLPATNVTS